MPTKTGITPAGQQGVVPDPDAFVQAAIQHEQQNADNYTVLGSNLRGRALADVLSRPRNAVAAWYLGNPTGGSSIDVLGDAENPNAPKVADQMTGFERAVRERVAQLPIDQRMAYAAALGAGAYLPQHAAEQEEAAHGGGVAGRVHSLVPAERASPEHYQ